jgi:RimJ/RimL family protein N-acetyltransferase
MTTITGKRIKIRGKKLSDAKEDYAWQTDPELAKLDAATPLEMTYQKYISEYTFELCYPSTSRCEFAVENLKGEHFANCVYYNINPSESQAEIGIMIGNRDYWNQGYGSEIIQLLLDYVINTAKLNRIYLTTLAWNIRAQKCFKKCGFKEIGMIERDHRSFVLMSINREGWAKFHDTIACQHNTAPSVEQQA